MLTWVASVAMTAVMATVPALAQAPAANNLVSGVTYSGQTLVSNRIMDATNMEYSPDYTDLYLIEAFDKSRFIRIYCNASSCYKLRGTFKLV